MCLDRLLELEKNRHFWLAGKDLLIRDLVRKTKPSTILDFGCGTGALLKQLAPQLKSFTGLDTSSRAIEICRQIMPAGRFLHLATNEIPLPDSSFDLVLALDTLEHINNEHTVLRELYRILKPNGKLVITVPAHQALYSNQDKSAGHFRRYGQNQLKTLLRKHNFLIKKISYYNFILFPLFVISRIFNLREDTPPKVVNFIFGLITGFEAKIIPSCSLPWGSTLYVIGEKAIDV